MVKQALPATPIWNADVWGTRLLSEIPEPPPGLHQKEVLERGELGRSSSAFRR